MTLYVGTNQPDTYVAPNESNTIIGLGGDDTLTGGSLDDVISGGDGADTLNGGDGVDHIATDSGDSQFGSIYGQSLPTDAGIEHDVVNAGGGDDVIYAGYGDDVDGGDGYDVLYLNLLGASAGVNINFTQPATVVNGGTITNIEAYQSFVGTNFADTLTLYANRYVYAMGGNDTITTGEYTQIVDGGDGNDMIDARVANGLTAVFGGAGKDTITVNDITLATVSGGAGSDTIVAGGLIHGDAGNDTITVLNSYYGKQVFGDAGDDHITGQAFDPIGGGGRSTNNIIAGGSGADYINGNDGADILVSDDFAVTGPGADYTAPAEDRGLQKDTLIGGAGDDQISIGYGDAADGGAGTDSLVLALYGAGAAGTGVTFNVASLASPGGLSLGGGTIKGFEKLIWLGGTDFADTLTIGNTIGTLTVHGDGGNDRFVTGNGSTNVFGDDGNDTLISGPGADTFHGGAGTDTIDYSKLAVEITVKLGAPGQFGTGPGGDLLEDVENVTGTKAADVIVGNDEANYLRGMGGYDTIRGGGGNDRIDGGDGGGKLFGGLGNDTYYVRSAGDLVTENADEGTDTVIASISYTLRNYVETLVLSGNNDIDGTGTNYDNTITGNSGANVINGLRGSDVIAGGGGLDTLDGGEGYDIYVIAAAADHPGAEITDTGTGVYDKLDTVVFTTTGSDTLTIFAGDTGIENVRIASFSAGKFSPTGGNAGIDASASVKGLNLLGNFGDNTIIGSAFNDTLSGGAHGTDTLIGGGGDDRYLVTAKTIIVEAANGGNDRAEADVSYTLSDNVERLVLLGTGAINGTGSSTDNRITGNDAANVLDGGGGNDVLEGHKGDDTLIGGAGNDTLYGDAGKDTLTGGTGADTFVFAPGSFYGTQVINADRITDFSHAEGDRIDLMAIDANAGLAGDQAFAFIGDAAFSHVAGELRAVVSDGFTLVEGDTNGDGKYDFVIALTGAPVLAAGDFVL